MEDLKDKKEGLLSCMTIQERASLIRTLIGESSWDPDTNAPIKSDYIEFVSEIAHLPSNDVRVKLISYQDVINTLSQSPEAVKQIYQYLLIEMVFWDGEVRPREVISLLHLYKELGWSQALLEDMYKKFLQNGESISSPEVYKWSPTEFSFHVVRDFKDEHKQVAQISVILVATASGKMGVREKYMVDKLLNDYGILDATSFNELLKIVRKNGYSSLVPVFEGADNKTKTWVGDLVAEVLKFSSNYTDAQLESAWSIVQHLQLMGGGEYVKRRYKKLLIRRRICESLEGFIKDNLTVRLVHDSQVDFS